MRRALPLVALALLSAACKGSPGPEVKGDAYYKNLNCQACHRIGAEGSERGGPDLTLLGLRKSPEWLHEFLKDPKAWRPGTPMPNPRLSEPARAKLVEYLAGLKGQDWPQRPWHGLQGAAKGESIYMLAGCVTCHGKGGAGGYPNNNVPGKAIPALAGAKDRFTKAELKSKIAKGVIPEKADPSGPQPLLRMPAWSEYLKDEELDAVVEYVWSLKAGTSDGAAW
jgi:mono/diheme cytochrome c family protein